MASEIQLCTLPEMLVMLLSKESARHFENTLARSKLADTYNAALLETLRSAASAEKVLQPPGAELIVDHGNGRMRQESARVVLREPRIRPVPD